MNNGSPAKIIMVQGTSSHAGKSILATALCRIFARDGLQVAPFKAQNMSLNSFATPDGGEIGRSQAVQSAAAMTAPRVEMNPLLLKPEGDNRSQVVLMGRPHAVKSARDYYKMKPRIWNTVTAALDRLRAEYDVIVIEGAGSPAEVNLKQHDIVNMRVALHSGAPVLLVGDIDRGGVFAQLVGTMVLLEPEERALVKGLVINKFRGDSSLLTDGLDFLERHTGTPVAGVIPYFTDIHIAEEDSLGLVSEGGIAEEAAVDVAVIRLPHIANFDDFDPLVHEPSVHVRYAGRVEDYGDPDLVIIPGSKTTVADLDWLRSMRLDESILASHRKGVPVVGICAGYQILGNRLFDPDGVESPRSETAGLGLLPTSTTFLSQKSAHQVKGRVAAGKGMLSGCEGSEVIAYEIHMGSTASHGLASPFNIESRSGRTVSLPDGSMDPEGMTVGTYLHGLFHNRAVRRSILECAARQKGVALPPSNTNIEPSVEYDKLAALVSEHLDMDLVYRVTGLAR